jgi:hypothetical protein
MPSASNISINDQLAVAQVFTPETVNPSQTVLKRSNGTTLLGVEKIIFSYTPGTVKKQSTLVSVRLNTPIESTDSNGNVSVKDTLRFEGVFMIPLNTTEDQRLRYTAMVQNLVANSITESYVVDADPMY